MSEAIQKRRYADYLKLDQILSSQVLASEKAGNCAHDEMLFIVIHQVYELWFKQMLWEVDSIRAVFSKDFVPEDELSVTASRLDRVEEILRVAIAQVKILQTMTPLDFLDFRQYLGTMSGFQSLQFRLLENKLGVPHRSPPDDGRRPKSLERLRQSEEEPSLFKLLEGWLERLPFLDLGSFSFLEVYREAVDRMFAAEKERIEADRELNQSEKQTRLELQQTSRGLFETMLDQSQHEELVRKGERRFSYRATLAALFVRLYRDYPILQLPYRILTEVVEVDELLSIWRHRHTLMVARMIGRKMGTGGSSGYNYLKSTIEGRRIFTDLFDLSTYLVPRGDLPDLPEDVKRALGFAFSGAQPTCP